MNRSVIKKAVFAILLIVGGVAFVVGFAMRNQGGRTTPVANVFSITIADHWYKQTSVPETVSLSDVVGPLTVKLNRGGRDTILLRKGNSDNIYAFNIKDEKLRPITLVEWNEGGQASSYETIGEHNLFPEKRFIVDEHQSEVTDKQTGENLVFRGNILVSLRLSPDEQFLAIHSVKGRRVESPFGADKPFFGGYTIRGRHFVQIYDVVTQAIRSGPTEIEFARGEPSSATFWTADGRLFVVPNVPEDEMKLFIARQQP